MSYWPVSNSKTMKPPTKHIVGMAVAGIAVIIIVQHWQKQYDHKHPALA